VSICLLVLKGRSLPRAEMRDDALDGRPYGPCKNLRDQREQTLSEGLPGPAALDSVRRARIIRRREDGPSHSHVFRNGFDGRPV
jgi:hypothetical protein